MNIRLINYPKVLIEMGWQFIWIYLKCFTPDRGKIYLQSCKNPRKNPLLQEVRWSINSRLSCLGQPHTLGAFRPGNQSLASIYYDWHLKVNPVKCKAGADFSIFQLYFSLIFQCSFKKRHKKGTGENKKKQKKRKWKAWKEKAF